MQVATRLLKTFSPPSVLAEKRFMMLLMSCPCQFTAQEESNRLVHCRAARTQLEALSNRDGSSHCHPFNYVVWVSTVVVAKARWGHAAGGFCSCLVCKPSVCVYGQASRPSKFVLKCVFSGEWAITLRLSKCLYSLSGFVWFTLSFSSAIWNLAARIYSHHDPRALIVLFPYIRFNLTMSSEVNQVSALPL